ncbi:MAG: CRTAC1 family protein [Deltaproteobacteria bacterium]|nr:CRTAC1 family protein [Deltaproteobacteria bacterium]
MHGQRCTSVRLARLAPVLVVALVQALAGAAHAQPADLIYDDGTPSGSLRDLAPGDIEVTRMTPEHPARLLSVELYTVAGGCTLHAAVWPDDGGNAPDVDHPLWEEEQTVDAAGWVSFDLPAGAVVLDPPHHFYVGHVLQDPACQLSWDGSGSDEPRSLARIGGNWYQIIDSSTPPRYLDALARAHVEYFDVRTEFDFEDATAASGLPAGMGRMAWGDCDGDGDDDLLVDGGRLFRNDGDASFADVTDAAGIGGHPTNGGVWADFDNDGDLDFYATVNNYYRDCTEDADCTWCTIVTNPDGTYACGETHDDHTCSGGFCLPPSGVREHDRLWRNEGDGTFTDVSEEAGRPYDYLPSEAAAWGDYDGDGFVDLYVANYEKPVEWSAGALSVGTPDQLWRNQGDGTFADATAAAGVVATRARCGRGVSWADYDRDGDLDLYVANYRLNPNFFYRNRGDGTFEEIARANGTEGIPASGAWGHSIGAAWGDVDNDGDWDLFVANLAHPRFITFSDKSMLYVSSGAPDFLFTDIREEAGIAYSETHSNPAWGDVENDGDIDLFLTDIYVGYRSFLYRNDGDNTFTDATYPSGIDVDNGWGCAWADADRDGRLDLATRSFWLNRTPDAGHWLEVRLAGTDSNAAAIGAQVAVTAGGRTMLRQVEGGSGTGVQNSLILHFGLGSATQAATVSIRWPSGLVEDYADVDADQVVTYREGDLANPPEDGGDGGEVDGAEDVPDEAGGDAGAPSGGGGCSCRAAGGGVGGELLLVLGCWFLVRTRTGCRSSRRT